MEEQNQEHDLKWGFTEEVEALVVDRCVVSTIGRGDVTIAMGVEFVKPQGICGIHGEINKFGFVFYPLKIGFCAKCLAEAWVTDMDGAPGLIRTTFADMFILTALSLNEGFSEVLAASMIDRLGTLFEPIKLKKGD